MQMIVSCYDILKAYHGIAHLYHYLFGFVKLSLMQKIRCIIEIKRFIMGSKTFRKGGRGGEGTWVDIGSNH